MTKYLIGNDMVAARIFGVSFIFAFLSYGFGNATIEAELAGLGDATVATFGFQSAIISLMIIHTFANIAVLTIMYVILARYSRFLATGYLMLGVVATVALLIGGGLLALIPQANGVAGELGQDLVALLHKGNFVLYQAGMTIWGVGGMLMCIVLWRTKLVPSWLPVWGFLGYAIFIFGTLSEFFDSGMGVQLSLLGGLFEIGLSVYLMLKGFDHVKANKEAA